MNPLIIIGGRREFDLFAGSAVLAAQVRRFQDRETWHDFGFL